MLQLVTRLHAGVKAASRCSPSKGRDQACPIVLVLGTNRVCKTGILLAPPERWGLAGKPPDNAILLSYSDIQWLFPTDLFRLSLHFCQHRCTSGVGKCRFFSGQGRAAGGGLRSAWELGTDLRQLLLALKVEERCCIFSYR